MLRHISIGLAFALAAALVAAAGCDMDRRAGVSTQPRVLSFWHIQTNPATARVIVDAVGRFETAHPDVAVKSAAVENDQYKLKLQTAMGARKMPDVFHTWGGGRLAEFVREKQVMDLTDAAKADNITSRILPAALAFGAVDGKLYAVPMDMSVVVMWYRKSVFLKNGIEPPATWAELKSACAKLRSAGVTPIALGNSKKWPGAFYFTYLATRLGGTKPFADAAARSPGGSFEHPSFIEAGKLLQDLAKSGAFNPGADALGYDEARDMFLKGDAAMILMGTWLLADVKPDVLADIDCFAFPEIEGGKGDPKIVVGGINSAYSVSADTANPDAAVALLKELTGDITELKWGETGRIPALRADLAEGMIQPAAYPAARLLYKAPEVQLYYDQALPSALAEAHKSTTQALISGTETPEEAARTMEQAASEHKPDPQ